MTLVRGKALRVGDVISVWWEPNKATITALTPYRGQLAYLFSEGAQVATLTAPRTKRGVIESQGEALGGRWRSGSGVVPEQAKRALRSVVVCSAPRRQEMTYLP